MKYLLLIIALLVAVVAALMFVPVKDGQPLLSPDKVQATLESAGAPVAPSDSAYEADVLPTMFRWRDSKGNWQYGDRPPPGVAAEPVEDKGVKSIREYDQQQETP